MKIVNKKRFILSLAILILVITSIFKFSFAESIHTEEYTVAAGDTLWSIACENATGDVRKYVYDLKQINNIEDCIIYPGQVIQIMK